MYSIKSYGDMIAEHVRTDAYVKALKQAVKPGSVVLDIGTGAGIFAILACKLGALKVYAIEPDEVIHLARRIAADNGCASSIEFIQDLSTKVNLPERVDVIIGDLHGRFALYEHHVISMADARERFLAPGGVMIPQQDELWAALVEVPKAYGSYTNPWVENAYGLNMQAGKELATSHVENIRVTPEQLLTLPQCWATIDFATVSNPTVSGQLSWSVERAGTCHGMAAWFDTTTVKGAVIGNGPFSAEYPGCYGPILFPWTHPVAVTYGDKVEVDLKAHFIGGDYLWQWNTQVWAQGDAMRAKESFRQSTFSTTTISKTQLRKHAIDWVPRLGENGRIDAFVLQLMDKGIELGEISRQLATLYPKRFATWQVAQARVGELSIKYSL